VNFNNPEISRFISLEAANSSVVVFPVCLYYVTIFDFSLKVDQVLELFLWYMDHCSSFHYRMS